MQHSATRTAAPRRPALVVRIAARAIAALRTIATSDAHGLTREAFNHRVLYRLSVMSDRDLGAIGLTRRDVEDAGRLEGGDATHFLIERREARRTARFSRYPF